MNPFRAFFVPPGKLLACAALISFLVLAGGPPANGAVNYGKKAMVMVTIAMSNFANRGVWKDLPSDFRLLIERKYPSGLHAAAFENTKHKDSVVVVYLGTQTDDPRDIMADLGIVGSNIGAKGNAFLRLQVADAEKFFDRVASLKQKSHNNRPIKKSDITVAGHSLGGFLAQVITWKKKAKKGVTINPPGARKFLKLSAGTARRANVENHLRKSDIVGRFGKHIGKVWIYPDPDKPAKYRGKPGCPGGSFFDLRKGGECWSCPRGQKRTIFPVTGDKACEVPLHESLKRAKYHKRTGCRGKRQFFDPRKGGECWSCPKGYGRSVFSVTSNKACAKGLRFKRAKYHGKSGCVGRGQFFDPRKGGQCWSCPGGYNRTAYAVTSSRACSKLIRAKRTKAKFVRKGGICPSGQFFDPRKGGQCWSCPKGFDRSVTPVTSKRACFSILKNHDNDEFLADFNSGMRGKLIKE